MPESLTLRLRRVAGSADSRSLAYSTTRGLAHARAVAWHEASEWHERPSTSDARAILFRMAFVEAFQELDVAHLRVHGEVWNRRDLRVAAVPIDYRFAEKRDARRHSSQRATCFATSLSICRRGKIYFIFISATLRSAVCGNFLLVFNLALGSGRAGGCARDQGQRSLHTASQPARSQFSLHAASRLCVGRG